MSCQEYTAIAINVPSISAMERIHVIPPHSMNWLSVSMSAVTRETKAPRFSALCSAIERAWMCAKVRTLRFLSASSEARTRRVYVARPAK